MKSREKLSFDGGSSAGIGRGAVMHSQIKLLQKLVVCTLFFVLTTVAPLLLINAQAYTGATVSTFMTDLKASTKKAVYNINLNAPFSKESSGIREVVNTETGALTVTNKILSIPGRNGMDINLTLVYYSQAAKLFDEGTSSPSISHSVGLTTIANYEVYDSSGHWLRTDALQYVNESLIQGTVTQGNETWVFNGYYQQPNDSSLTKSNGIANCTREMSVGDASRYVFGVGWSLYIPSLYVDGTTVYVSLPNGQTYKADPSNSSGLENYTLTDVSFGADTSMNNGINTSAYRLLKADGSAQYFTATGELMLETDRFGNQITYFWTSTNNLRLLTKIVDSAGRVVTLEYNNTGTYVTYDNKTITLSKTAIPNYTGKYYLSGYSDALGNTTSYSYSLDSAAFDIYGGTAVNNTYADLCQISYQTGFSTNYTYTTGTKNLAVDGNMKYNKIQSRWDSVGATSYNAQSYSYVNEPDGYPAYKAGAIGSNYTYGSIVYNKNGETINYWYNFKHQLTKKESIVPDVKTVVETTYDKDLNVPTKVTAARMTDESGYIVSVDTYSYNSRGNLISENHPVDPDDLDSGQYVTDYVYDSKFNLLLSKTYKQDADTTVKVVNTLSKDGKSVAESEIYTNNALSRVSCYDYDDCGNLTRSVAKMSDTKWSVISYIYGDKYAKVYPTYVVYAQAKNASGSNLKALKSFTYAYDFYSGKTLSSEDGNENVTLYSYDLLGRILKETLPDGSCRTTSYNDKKNTLVTTDATGAGLKYYYDPFGKLASVMKVQTGKVIVKNEYDSRDNLISTTDANGSMTSYTYDNLERLTSVAITDKNEKNVSKKLVEYQENFEDDYGNTYDKITVTLVGDKINIVTTNYYNGRDQLVLSGRVADGAEQVKRYSYDYIGNTISTVDYDGAKTTYTYDAFGEALSTTDPNGNTTKYGYDMAGNQISVTNALGVTSYSFYDGVGNIVEKDVKHGDAGNAVTKYYYDGAGNLIKTVDAKKNVTLHSYNNRGFLTGVEQKISSKKSNIVKMEYDAEGRITAQYTGLTSWDDPYFSVTRYKYDTYGNEISEKDSSGKTTTYKYDANGNVIETTDRNGVTTYNTYDGLDRPVSVYNSKDGKKKEIVYIYDLNGSLKQSGNANESADYKYDKYGRVIEINYDNGYRKVYTYDDGDRVASLTVKKGSATEYKVSNEYDAGGRRVAVVYNGLRTTYAFDTGNQLVSETNGLTGIKTTYGYTQFGAIEWMRAYRAGEIINNCGYTYDLLGNETRKYENGDITVYKYDALSRMSVALLPDGETQYYIFDDYGNIDRKVSGNGHYITETHYYYDDAGHLTLSSDGKGIQTRYEYDNNGNLINKEVSVDQYGMTYSIDSSYSYNGFNQLDRVETETGDRYEYAYNAEGMRISKTSENVEIGYVYENGYIILETDGNGQTTAKNVWGARLVERDENDDTYSYLFNGHGDITALTDGLGMTVKDYAYDPYGNECDTDAASATENDTNPFRYCGEYYDLETKTYYLRARNYDPTTGRFLSEDSYRGKSQDPLSLNLYTYCYNSPVKYHDPSGHAGELTLSWTGGMWWLAAVDGPIPIGDIIYFAGIGVMSIADAVNTIGVDNVALMISEAPNAIAQGIQWAGDKIQSAANKASNWFNKTFGGGGSASPGDPNNWNHRDYFLKQANNKELRNAISELYRKTASIGDGGTADALRSEIQNGQYLKHLQKAQNSIQYLDRILRTQELTEAERKLTYQLLNDLYDAVKHVPKQ